MLHPLSSKPTSDFDRLAMCVTKCFQTNITSSAKLESVAASGRFVTLSAGATPYSILRSLSGGVIEENPTFCHCLLLLYVRSPCLRDGMSPVCRSTPATLLRLPIPHHFNLLKHTCYFTHNLGKNLKKYKYISTEGLCTPYSSYKNRYYSAVERLLVGLYNRAEVFTARYGLNL